MIRFKIPIIACATALLACAPSDSAEKTNRATFNVEGAVERPQNHRQWVNVGTTLIPEGTVNIIDSLPIKTSEYIDTYVEPSAFAAYMKSGNWPDGTQIVKEFTATHEATPDDVLTEAHYNGLAMLVKDVERFPAETGHIGYFNFGHHPEPYELKSMPMPRQQCSACHEATASHQQYIFADHHIGLNRKVE